MAKIKLTRIVLLFYIGIVAVTIFVFTMLASMMENASPNGAWHIASVVLNSHQDLDENHVKKEAIGNIVDRVQKIGKAIENISGKIETMKKKAKRTKGERNNEHIRRFCHVPKPTTQYPLCEEKFNYVNINWGNPCFAMENNIRADDTCSILIYLSEVEHWCPRLPWRKASSTSKNILLDRIDRKINIRTNVDGLITKWFNDSNYQWMKNRITSMKKNWATAILNLNQKRQLTKRTKKRILVYLGAFSIVPIILERAFSGGALGELVQWSDIITSLYLLGHDVTVVKYKDEFLRYFPVPNKNGCINNDTVKQFQYDLLYTDITGIESVIKRIGPYWSEVRCKSRVVDSFGTEAEFNFKATDSKYKSIWGNLELNLRQFMTMFPHSPDNSFIGFVAGASKKASKKYAKKNMALVYGKQDVFWMVGNKMYLDKIHEYVEIHGTFNRTLGKLPHYIPNYVINHGIVNGTTIQKLLQQSKVFVGLGFPYEGPAPLEAAANGAAFLNPKYPVPHNRYNSEFFATKPTRRLVTSQNPYAAQFIGEPYVYTIDMRNVTQITRAMNKIMKNTLKPYLPFEYTHEGMLERMSAQIEHLDFCEDKQWPPVKNMKTVKGKFGQSCKDACWEKGMLCEPSYWDILNQLISFRRERISCDSVKYSNLLVAPSFEEKTKTCHFQQQPLLYSCVSSSGSHMRLCPCRDYIKDQVALCKDCW
ncbi:alpha-1,6-mannosylglycoprotein 6-beta-N-acetylglucosaminyltransferase A-like [Dendronephthya gigantea]|uniref:alpha-1,6-mannosylglycoprotein 6-beta-N-acetylglucosaminyltransferase A-like n=1 Tax=Dendronephthya gigantea TaxID=151771 RepID=UPI00106BDEA0|nr:alpha-1,6-mannosylglycoprotein 6-beta-N-acetylglucosaminyltransferase A-like [Dendronephthya gigantea]